MANYKVVDVAKMLDVSKVTIYEKMKLLKKELKPYIKLKGNVKYIDTQGIEIIRRSLKDYQEEENNQENFTKSKLNTEHDIEGSIENAYIQHLKTEIEYYRNQLKAKDEQINTHMELIQNFQVLIKQEQTKYLLLEEKYKEQQEAPKGFWSKLLKK